MTEEEIRKIAKNAKWGFLRETDELAKKAGIDKDTGLFRTGLPTYLKAIFPNIDDWIHDEPISKEEVRKLNSNITPRKFRPDYRSNKLMLIVEFDGMPHYMQPNTIKSDEEKNKYYSSLGYKVVRIPFFIQLSKEAIKVLFDVDMNYELFDDRIPSLGIKGKNTPAFLCGAGAKRMAEEFRKFPTQYKVNVEFLESQNDEYLSGAKLLKELYKRN